MITSTLQKIAEEYYATPSIPVQQSISALDSVGPYAVPALYGAGMGAGVGGLMAYTNEANAQAKALAKAQSGFESTKKRTRAELRNARLEKQKADAALKQFLASPVADPAKQKALNAAAENAKKNFEVVGNRTLNSMRAVRNNLAAAKAATPNLGRVALWSGGGALGGILGTGALLYGSDLLNRHKWDS